jgi:glutamyl endopeptidase
MKNFKPSNTSDQSSPYPHLSLPLFFAGLLFVVQTSAGPHMPVSNDIREVSPSEATAYSGAFPYGGDISASDEALFGRAAFEGAEGTPNESALLADGVELAGIEGEVQPGELDYLLSLPAIGGGLGQEVLLGSDTRVRLYTTTYPARAAVLITFTGGRCSGFMIGSNTVATAGHCVHSGGTSGAWRTNVRVYPGYDGTVAHYGSCTARTLYSVTGWTQSASEEYDYGAIKLNCTVGNSTGWFGWRSGAGNNTPAIITGYPGDKPLQMWQSSDKIRSTTTLQLFYSNDTVGGMSGSPVWEDWWSSNLSRGPYAIAIHAYGTHGSSPHSIYNHGTRITSAVSTNLLNWKNAR